MNITQMLRRTSAALMALGSVAVTTLPSRAVDLPDSHSHESSAHTSGNGNHNGRGHATICDARTGEQVDATNAAAREKIPENKRVFTGWASGPVSAEIIEDQMKHNNNSEPERNIVRQKCMLEALTS